MTSKRTNLKYDLILLDVPTGKQRVLSGVKANGSGGRVLISRDCKVFAFTTGSGAVRLWDVVRAERDSMTESVNQTLRRLLDVANVAYRVVCHEPCPTSEESARMTPKDWPGFWRNE